MASPSRRTEAIAFEPGWNSLSGRILSGGFELQEILAADEWQANLKVRVLGDRELDCAAHLFRLPRSIADQQVALWQITRELRHPNLSAPLGAGTVDIEGECAAYVVVRRADESLNAVLAERALTVEETQEALDSVTRGLEALHLNGLAHGCLSPSQVLAVGEAIKLPVGCVRPLGAPPFLEIQKTVYLAPESTGENLTAEADLWCLGATVYEALTQQAWNEDGRAHLHAIPEPFATIASRCLEDDPSRRANLEEVVGLLSGKLKPAPRILVAPPPVASDAGPETAAVAGVTPGESSSAAPRVYIEDSASAVTSVKDQARAATASAAMPVSAAVNLQEPSIAYLPDTNLPTASVLARDVVAEPGARGDLSAAALPSASSIAQTSRALPEAISNTPSGKSEDVRPILVARPRWEDVVGHQAANQEEEHSSTNLWIWAVAALLVVVGLIWILRPKPALTTHLVAPVTTGATSAAKSTAESATAGGLSGKQPAGSGTVAKPAGAWETRTLQPDGSAPRVAIPVPPGKAASSPSPVAKPGPEPWRLVLYTYRSQEDARRKANSLNSSHAGLHCEVFSPSGSGSPYLVVAGGRMSREQAAQFRRKALSYGLPHDSYIQNYKH